MNTITPINNQDMTHLARLLLSVKRSERRPLAEQIYANAERAFGNPDPAVRNLCGTGSISSAAQQHSIKMSVEPYFTDEEYRHCWQVALDVVAWNAPVRSFAA